MQIKAWLENKVKRYRSFGDDFPNYSPKQEKYYGMADAYIDVLMHLPDNILEYDPAKVEE